MAFCTKCGKEISNTANFCTGCGALMTGSAGHSQVPVAAKPTVLPEKKSQWIIIGGVVLIALFVTAYFLFIKNKKDEQANTAPAVTSAASLPGIYPHASLRSLTYDDISNLSQYQLRIMRNEIYARHSYIFQNNELHNYFSAQSWYTPRYNYVTDMLSDLEKSNIEFIKQFEH